MPYIIIDTEYTTWPGALESGWSKPGQHREIVQIGAVLVDDNFVERASLMLLIKPAVNPQLSDLFVSLTKITQAQVDAEGISFKDGLKRLVAFCGNAPVICMNADEAVFRENCRLNDIEFPFTASWHRLRPHLEKSDVDLNRNSSGDLHKLTPSPLTGHTHDALHDVRSMACWLNHSKPSLQQLPTGAPTFDPRSNKKHHP